MLLFTGPVTDLTVNLSDKRTRIIYRSTQSMPLVSNFDCVADETVGTVEHSKGSRRPGRNGTHTWIFLCESLHCHLTHMCVENKGTCLRPRACSAPAVRRASCSDMTYSAKSINPKNIVATMFLSFFLRWIHLQIHSCVVFSSNQGAPYTCFHMNVTHV